MCIRDRVSTQSTWGQVSVMKQELRLSDDIAEVIIKVIKIIITSEKVSILINSHFDLVLLCTIIYVCQQRRLNISSEYLLTKWASLSTVNRGDYEEMENVLRNGRDDGKEKIDDLLEIFYEEIYLGKMKDIAVPGMNTPSTLSSPWGKLGVGYSPRQPSTLDRTQVKIHPFGVQTDAKMHHDFESPQSKVKRGKKLLSCRKLSFDEDSPSEEPRKKVKVEELFLVNSIEKESEKIHLFGGSSEDRSIKKTSNGLQRSITFNLSDSTSVYDSVSKNPLTQSQPEPTVWIRSFEAIEPGQSTTKAPTSGASQEFEFSRPTIQESPERPELLSVRGGRNLCDSGKKTPEFRS
eukprot:TRINITY_DN5412_c0_g1_i8.p1 TRINITY_DN5412_c0_g1~~TRINITY_DN5412_c0_g1_i8.p1  ORF type:complete len:349 (-),score=67.14 TRINITY_DN5412_c0_g1_i8:131-1177(-)